MMIAITIAANEEQQRLARVTASCVAARTGLHATIVDGRMHAQWRVRRADYMKFVLFEMFPEASSILYFDPEYVFLRDWDPTPFARFPALIGSQQISPRHELKAAAALVGVGVEDYLSAGFFIANREHHAGLLGKALHDIAQYEPGCPDHICLNRARHVLQLPAICLSAEFGSLSRDGFTFDAQVAVGHLLPAPQHEEVLRRQAIWMDAAGRAPVNDILMSCSTSACNVNANSPDLHLESLYRLALDECIKSLPEYPHERFKGRGIVICGGGLKYFPSAWVCIRMLRFLGCELPIELWHIGSDEVSPHMADLVRPFNVRCVDAALVRQEHPVRILKGYELKAYALIHCAFEEVLLLDADNVPVRNPEYLFEDRAYASTGAMFWPDFGRLSERRRIWEITGVEYRDEPEFESGQIVVDKRRSWHALQVAMHLNEHSDYYYRHIHGDKDTFHFAWRKLGQPYSMPSRGIQALEGTMCQHDMDGVRLFQHRNFDKWQAWGENRRILDFYYEPECLEFLDELRAVWNELPNGMRRYCRSAAGGQVPAVAERLKSELYLYERVGHDERPMEFRANGTIGIGSAGCEQFWDLREDKQGVWLDIFGQDGLTLSVVEERHGHWQGAWLIHERMPVTLRVMAS